MQLHRLKLVNFRLHAETEIVFDRGVTAIVGPNGAGKTTLLEALAWGLFGSPAARGSRDAIRRRGAPARAPVRVEVEFSLGAHDYRIVRNLYGAELYQDGGANPIANSQQAVSSKVAYLLGMNREEFFSTYFTGQKELAVMASMGASERARFLSRLLGYEKLRLAQDELRARRSAIRGEVTGLDHGLESQEALDREHEEAARKVTTTKEAVDNVSSLVRQAESEVAGLRPRWNEMQRVREATLSMEGERGMAEQQVRDSRREFERIDRELATALLARDRLRELQPDLDRAQALRAEFEQLDRAARDAGQRRSLTGQLGEVTEQLARVHVKVSELGDAEHMVQEASAALRETQQALAQLRAREQDIRTTWIRDKQDAETKRLALRDQYKDVQRRRESILGAGPEGQCPTCARPLGTEFEAVLATLALQLEEIESNGTFFRQRVEQLATEPEDLALVKGHETEEARRVEEVMQRMARSEARMRERAASQAEHERLCLKRREIEQCLEALPEQYDADRLEVVREELRTVEESVRLATELRVRAERAETLVSEAEAAERLLSEREERVRQLTEAIAQSGFSPTAYAELKKQSERSEAALRDLQIREVAVHGDLKAATAQLESVERRRKERQARVVRIAELRREFTLHDELDSALEDLRAELNARLRPDLAELASAFLADLTDGRYHELDLDEQYRLTIIEDGLPKPVISGGEEDIANLVLRVAISQMVSERAGVPLSLLVLDEIFGGLDEHRRENVVELLRGLASRFPQVVLITHIDAIKHGVDRVLRVSLDAESGVARVTEEEPFVPEENAA